MSTSRGVRAPAPRAPNSGFVRSAFVPGVTYTGRRRSIISGYCLGQHGDPDPSHKLKLYKDIRAHVEKFSDPTEKINDYLDFPIIDVLGVKMGLSNLQVRRTDATYTGVNCTWIIPGPSGQPQYCSMHFVGKPASTIGHYEKHKKHPDSIPCPKSGCNKVFKEFKKFKKHYDTHFEKKNKLVTPFPTVPVIPSVADYVLGQWHMSFVKPRTDPHFMRLFLLNLVQYTKSSKAQMKDNGCFGGADDLFNMYNQGQLATIPDFDNGPARDIFSDDDDDDDDDDEEEDSNDGSDNEEGGSNEVSNNEGGGLNEISNDDDEEDEDENGVGDEDEEEGEEEAVIPKVQGKARIAAKGKGKARVESSDEEDDSDDWQEDSDYKSDIEGDEEPEYRVDPKKRTRSSAPSPSTSKKQRIG